MLAAIEGHYRNGKIELNEVPEGISESRVIVTFLPDPSQRASNGDAPATPGKMVTYGMFPQLLGLTDEDFRSAEWRGDDENV